MPGSDLDRALRATTASVVIASATEPDHPIVFVNDAFVALTGYPREEVMGRNCRFLQTPETAEGDRAALREAAARGEPAVVTILNRTRDGRPFWNEVYLAPVRDGAGRLVELVAIQHDVSERVAASRRVAAAEDRYRNLVERQPFVTYLLGSGAPPPVRYASGQIADLLGHPPEAFYADPGLWARLLHPDDAPRMGDALTARLASPGFDDEYRMIAADGRTVWVWDRDASGAGAGRTEVQGTLIDITQRKVTERRLVHLGLHDPLTGLPNRALFEDRLAQAIARTARGGRRFAVCFLDLDGFKRVNDERGHRAGDALLRGIGARLLGAVRPSDTVARFGGDEFTVLCEDVDDERQVRELAERVRTAIAAPLEVDGRSTRTTASVGIAMGGPGADPAGVLAQADAALYRAKGEGRSRTAFFDEGMRRRSARRAALSGALEALTSDQLELHYQPMIDLADGGIVAAEALVRWRLPGQGLLAPRDFLPVAAEERLLPAIDAWVLELACAQLADWRVRLGSGALSLSVNLSAQTLDGGRLPAMIGAALAGHGLPGDRLLVEVAERALVADPDVTAQQLDGVRAQGVRLVVDDFGADFASLALLRDLTLDGVKLGRSLAAGIERAPDRAIVAAVVGITDALGLLAVAAGVESGAQLDALRALGCRVGQGFRLGRPVPASELERLLVRS